MPNPKKPRANCAYCGTEVKRPVDKFCDNRCQRAKQYNDNVARWKAGEVRAYDTLGKPASYIYRYMREKYNNACAECGWCKMNEHTGRIPLQLHHRDGNFRNVHEDNLVLLCPNCHALTPTHGIANRGNGRPYKRINLPID